MSTNHLTPQEQACLTRVLNGLDVEAQGLFSQLVERLDEGPRKVLMLIANGAVSNKRMAAELDCAPASIARYRRAIRRKLEEIAAE